MKRSFLQHWWPTIALVAMLLIMTRGFTCPPCGFTSEAYSAGRATATNQEENAMPVEQTANKIEHVTRRDFEDKVLNAKEAVLVDFYATWCGPCKALSPVLADFASETSDVTIVKVNVDEEPELATHYGVSSIPNLIVFKNGQPAGRHVGMANKALLKRLLSK